MNGREEIFHRNTMLAMELASRSPDRGAGRVANALLHTNFGQHWPLFILGPCAIQSAEQIEEITHEITEHSLSTMVIALRICHDKPRSHTITFDGRIAWDGIGVVEVVPILKAIKKEHPETLIF